MVTLLVSLGLWGCTQPPVYNGITEVIVHKQTAGGTNKETLEGERFDKATRCLYTTTEIPADQSKQELLQEILLIQVKDRLGDRMFEFYTDVNLKGNKGKYYYNDCIYRVIKAM